MYFQQPTLNFFDVAEVAKINRQMAETAISEYQAASHVRIPQPSPEFLTNLAEDSAVSKMALRSILSRSRYWEDDAQACIIPDVVIPYEVYTAGEENPAEKTSELISKAWRDAGAYDRLGYEALHDLSILRGYFSGFAGLENQAQEILAKYLPKKFLRRAKTKQLVAITDKLHLNSYKFKVSIGEISARIDQKNFEYDLWLSISPADFLTMSNPKYGDNRSMISCMSLDGDCRYRQGTIGYARDAVTIVAFLLPKGDRSRRFTKKLARQLFFFCEGALIQSRLYTTRTLVTSGYGGISTDADAFFENKLFRHAIQGVIAHGLGRQNYWRVCDYKNGRNKYGVQVEPADRFGGYADWEAFSNEKHMIRISRLKYFEDSLPSSFEIGAAGLSFASGEWLRIDEDIE